MEIWWHSGNIFTTTTTLLLRNVGSKIKNETDITNKSCNHSRMYWCVRYHLGYINTSQLYHLYHYCKYITVNITVK